MNCLKNIILYSAFSFALLLPFNTSISNIVFGLFLVTSISFHISTNQGLNKNNLIILKYSSILLLSSCFISLFFLKNFDITINQFGRRITYLLCPLIFAFFDKKTLREIKKTSFYGLCYGLFLSSSFMLVNILLKYYKIRSLFSISKDILNYNHTHNNYTSILDIHPSYYGLYLLLGFVILFYGNVKFHKMFKFFMISIFVSSLIFLNSRSVTFLFLLLTIIHSLNLLFSKTKSYILSALIFGSLFFVILCSFYFLLNRTYAFQRLVKESSWELSYEINSKYNSKGKGDSRLARWHAAIELIKKKPIVGYGVGKERSVLAEQYSKMQMYFASEKRYNSHNQYLGVILEGGMVSFLFFLIFLISNLVISIKYRDIIFCVFVINISVISVVENIFIRNAGIIFIAFFSSLFLFSIKLKK